LCGVAPRAGRRPREDSRARRRLRSAELMRRDGGNRGMCWRRPGEQQIRRPTVRSHGMGTSMRTAFSPTYAPARLVKAKPENAVPRDMLCGREGRAGDRGQSSAESGQHDPLETLVLHARTPGRKFSVREVPCWLRHPHKKVQGDTKENTYKKGFSWPRKASHAPPTHPQRTARTPLRATPAPRGAMPGLGPRPTRSHLPKMCEGLRRTERHA
jgi:hypothetical protein